MRLILPASGADQTRNSSPCLTTHTAVGTGVPSFLKVVSSTYSA